MQPVARETFVERRQSYLRWSAIAAGLVVALAAWLTLQLLGVGVGLTAVDVDADGSLRGAGIGAGVWSVIAPLIALFIGGYVAAHMSNTWNRAGGAVHGLVLWALTTVVGAFLVMRAVGAIADTTAAAASSAVDVGARLGPHAFASVGIDPDTLVDPINDRLREQGKPEVSADDVRRALRGTIRRSLREGTFDRRIVVRELARNTALDRGDAEDVAAQLETRWNDEVRDARVQARRSAREVVDAAGKSMLSAGVALLLGLGAAVGGGVLGAWRRGRDREGGGGRARRIHVTSPGHPVPPPPPAVTPPPDTAV
jgi:hypothetical protein